MSMQVSDGQNSGYVVLCDKEYAKRKAMKDGSSNLAADERKLEGRLLDADKCGA